MADYVSILKRTLDGLGDSATPSLRERVYARAREAVKRQLDGMNPPPAEGVAAKQYDVLERAIAEVEAGYADAAPPVPDEPETPPAQDTSPSSGTEGAAPPASDGDAGQEPGIVQEGTPAESGSAENGEGQVPHAEASPDPRPVPEPIPAPDPMPAPEPSPVPPQPAPPVPDPTDPPAPQPTAYGERPVDHDEQPVAEPYSEDMSPRVGERSENPPLRPMLSRTGEVVIDPSAAVPLSEVGSAAPISETVARPEEATPANVLPEPVREEATLPVQPPEGMPFPGEVPPVEAGAGPDHFEPMPEVRPGPPGGLDPSLFSDPTPPPAPSPADDAIRPEGEAPSLTSPGDDVRMPQAGGFDPVEPAPDMSASPPQPDPTMGEPPVRGPDTLPVASTVAVGAAGATGATALFQRLADGSPREGTLAPAGSPAPAVTPADRDAVPGGAVPPVSEATPAPVAPAPVAPTTGDPVPSIGGGPFGDGLEPSIMAEPPRRPRPTEPKKSGGGLVLAAVILLAIGLGGGYYLRNEIADASGVEGFRTAFGLEPAVTGLFAGDDDVVVVDDDTDMVPVEDDAANGDTPVDVAVVPPGGETDAAADGPAKFGGQLSAEGDTVDTAPSDTDVVVRNVPVVPIESGTPAAGETANTGDDAPDADAGTTEVAIATSDPEPSEQQPGVPAAASDARAVLVDEAVGGAQAPRREGGVVWQVAQESPGSGLPPEPAIKGSVTLDNGVGMSMVMKRNADESLPASHLIELAFDLPEGTGAGGIQNLSQIGLKDSFEVRAQPLVGLAASISETFFIFGLNDFETAVESNLALMESEDLIEVRLRYLNGRSATLTLEKGDKGEEVFGEVLKAWQEKPLPG